MRGRGGVAVRGFVITQGKGFHVTFANGVTVSVQFGGGNYCDNYNESVMAKFPDLRPSGTAEVAVWDDEDVWYEWKHGRLTGGISGGWVSNRSDPAEVLAIMNAAASLSAAVPS